MVGTAALGRESLGSEESKQRRPGSSISLMIPASVTVSRFLP